MRLGLAYLATIVVFLGLDALWLSRLALGMYRAELGALLLERPNLIVGGLFYLLFGMGIVVLVVLPSLEAQSWGRALLHGALLGLVAYGTYDITNLSTLKGWSLTVTLVDIAWGSALTALAATAGYFAVALARL